MCNMDKYMVKDEMFPGCFGAVLFVKDRTSSLKYTLKRVECLDEGRANQALQEVLCLLKVEHPNIVRYKEFFISWDKSISSVMLSMVMECPYMKTLSTVINIQREVKIKIKNKVIKRYLGQMMDALAYLHHQGILHRNLKPSNILVTDEQNFLLCDFGTATIMGDKVKLQKRVKKCAKRWMAPESLTKQQWSEKSDVWSLGCVLLDMLTCHMLDEEASIAQLLRIKQDLAPLEVVVSTELHGTLGQMFDRDPETRPSVRELVKEPLVEKCLQLYGFSLDKIKKTLPPGVNSMPIHTEFASVLEFMQTYREVEAVQISVLSYLLTEDKEVFCRVADVVQSVTPAMKSHMDCAEVQLTACQVLQRLLIAVQSHGAEDSYLYSDEVIGCVLGAVQHHPELEDLLSQAFKLLLLFSGSEQMAESIVNLGGVQGVVRTLKTFPGNREICVSCCKCLWSLVTNGRCSDTVSTEEAVDAVCIVGETFLEDRVAVESVCAALWSLSIHGIHNDKDIEDSALLLMHALGTHPDSRGVVRAAFLALANLVKESELAAFRVLMAPSGGSGLALIQETSLHYHDDSEIMENVCSLLAEMTQHDDVLPELAAENMHDKLHQTEIRFASNKMIVSLVQRALSRMKKLG